MEGSCCDECEPPQKLTQQGCICHSAEARGPANPQEHPSVPFSSRWRQALAFGRIPPMVGASLRTSAPLHAARSGGAPPRLRVMASGCRPGHGQVPHHGQAQCTQPQPTCNRLFPNTPRPAGAPGGRARMLGSGAPTARRGPDLAPLQYRTQRPLPLLSPWAWQAAQCLELTRGWQTSVGKVGTAGAAAAGKEAGPTRECGLWKWAEKIRGRLAGQQDPERQACSVPR